MPFRNGASRLLKVWAGRRGYGGFEVIEIMGPFKIGKVVQDWESDILKYLRAHGAIIAKDAGIQKFDGYEESWLRATFPATSLKELRALVFDDEDAA